MNKYQKRHFLKRTVSCLGMCYLQNTKKTNGASHSYVNELLTVFVLRFCIVLLFINILIINYNKICYFFMTCSHVTKICYCFQVSIRSKMSFNNFFFEINLFSLFKQTIIFNCCSIKLNYLIN